MRTTPPNAPHPVVHVFWPELTGEKPFDGDLFGILDRDDEVVRETHRAVAHRSWLDENDVDDAA